MIKDTIIDGVLLFLLILALLGYIESHWPYMPEHGSVEWTESVFWSDK